LKSHILLYIGEHKGYPKLSSFQKFIERRLKAEREEYLNEINSGKRNDEKIANLERYPSPYVSYVPLPFKSKLKDEFIKFERITKVRIRQYNQNGSFSSNSFTRTNAALMEKVNTGKIDTTITKIGDIAGTQEIIEELSENTEAEFKVEGITDEGKKELTNDGIKYTQHLQLVSDDIDNVAEKMVGAFLSDVSNNIIPMVPQRNSDEKLKRLKYEKGND
jgi:hypothetical protein